MNSEKELEREIFESIGNANADNSVITITCIELACKTLDWKFGAGFHKKHPELVVQMTESFLANIRSSHISVTLKEIKDQIDEIRKDLVIK